MSHPGPAWYPDPTSRYPLRYWDGTRWTEHVASGGAAFLDPLPAYEAAATRATTPARRTPAGVFGLATLVLVLLTLGVLSVPGVGWVRAQFADGIAVDETVQEVRLAPDRTFGIYVDDRNNSGYSESCEVIDLDTGAPIPLRDPTWNISSSETENLDLVFDSGTGRVSVTCSVPGEEVTLREVPDDPAMFLAFLAAVIPGFLSIAAFTLWVTRRSSGRPQAGTPATATG